MSKVVEEAIDALRGLPQDRQATVASAIIEYASYEPDDLYLLSDDERVTVREGVDEAERGDFVSDMEVQTFRDRNDA